MQKLISIIIPLYNTEKYLEETIDSIINQNYQYWELIIVNDGSTDSSYKIAQNYIQKDNRISLITKENTGVSDTRNIGIKVAKGELIAFLDADDTWEVENLTKKVAILENPGIDWVFSDAKLIDEESQLIGEKTGDDSAILTDYLSWNKTVVPGPCSNVIVKRKCLENGLRFDSNFSTAADQDFCFRLSALFPGKRIPEQLWSYRILGNSMSRNISIMEKDHIGVYRKAAKDKLFNGFWFKQKCFSNLYLILAGSWWKNGNNKKRGMLFILKALLTYPPNVIKLFQKSFN